MLNPLPSLLISKASPSVALGLGKEPLLSSPQAGFHPRTLFSQGAWEGEPAQAPSLGGGGAVSGS